MTAVRSGPVLRTASATSLVGNGRNETAISSSRLSRMTCRFTDSSRLKMPWCASQMPPIVRKLVA